MPLVKMDLCASCVHRSESLLILMTPKVRYLHQFMLHHNLLKLTYLAYTDLPLVNKKKKGRGTISFTLEYLNAPELPRPLSSKAEEDANKLAASSDKIQSVAAPLSGVGEAAEGIANFYETWQLLLDKIGVVVKIASTIAEVTFS
jgi:hypothetical protein